MTHPSAWGSLVHLANEMLHFVGVFREMDVYGMEISHLLLLHAAGLGVRQGCKS